MSTQHNVTAPGGFFIGKVGIVVFILVFTALIIGFVTLRNGVDEHLDTRIATGLALPKDTPPGEIEKKTNELNAVYRHFGYADSSVRLTIEQIREIVRKRKAEALAQADAESLAKLKIDEKMAVVAKEIIAKKPVASAVKVDVLPPADPKAAPALPNVQGGGARTVSFALATPPAPAAPPAEPAPAATPAEPAK